MKPKDKMMDVTSRYSDHEICIARFVATYLAWWTIGFVIN
jgi:hypothetical protein